MVQANHDEAVTYVNSEGGFSSRRIVECVDCLIYNQRYQHEGRTEITISTTKIYLRMPIDILVLEVKAQLYFNLLSMSSSLKSTRILLLWSPELYVHYSVLHHGYIYHHCILGYSYYLRRRKKFIGKSARRYYGVQKKSEDQPDSVVVQRILLSMTLSTRYYSFCWGESMVVCHMRQVNTWSRRNLGQSVVKYKCRLLEQYSWVQRESEDRHNSVLLQRIFWVGYSWVVYIR